MSFATYFEWEVHPTGEDAFIEAWADATRHLRTHGSYGSALFRTDTGHFAALARWPDRATRDTAFGAAEFPDGADAMAREIIRTVHRIDLEGIVDLWAWPAT